MAPQLVFGIDDFHAKAGPAYHSRVADFTAARDRMEVLAGSETILLVEDSESCRRLLRMLLECSGYAVLEAAGGPEAAQIAANHRGAIHLLLTDVIMPGMSGRALVDSLTPLRPEMKVLYMSGYSDGVIARQGALENGITVLRKPFTKDELTRRVEEVLFSVPQ